VGHLGPSSLDSIITLVFYPMGQPSVAKHEQTLRGREYVLLFLFSIVLFGYSMIGGRPLTMHEAVLPQSSCEMLADGDWIIPKSGGRPWLERPPLPQWITVGTAVALGTCAKEWVVRLPTTLIATSVVLLLARMAANWFGRTIGLLSGLLLATMFEFTRYAWLAEADIFLCGIVTAAIAIFVHLEFFQKPPPGAPPRFWGSRSTRVWLFFVLLGMTNLVKGLLFGTVMTLAPLVGFLLWNANRTQIARYLWVWGWLVFLAIAGAWPLAAWLRYPDVIELWWFDLGGRLSGDYAAINQPLWYYPVTLAWVTLPWTIPAAFGLTMTWKRASDVPLSPERFLWCWAVLPIAVFSFASGKHHHYLLQCLAPWAVLGSLGLVWLRDRIFLVPSWKQATVVAWWLMGVLGAVGIWWFSARVPGPDWMPWALIAGWVVVAGSLSWTISHGNARWAMGIFLGAIVTLYALGYTYAARSSDQSLADTVFLKEVPARITAGVPLVVNADLDSMDVFRILFYLLHLGGQVVPIHNLTYLLDERIHDETIYLISRLKDLPTLTRYGTAEVVLQSQRTRRETSPQDRFTLFHLRFDKNLPRHPAPPYISPMQAMGRAQGPFIGATR
jgi:4-amino-4-deoxy-L-arabinose transferase-like glycosyltransferase